MGFWPISLLYISRLSWWGIKYNIFSWTTRIVDFVTSHGIHIFGSSRFQLKLKQIINEINIENHIVLSQTSRLYFAFSISSHPLFALILKQCEKYTAKYFAKYSCLSLSPLCTICELIKESFAKT